MISAAESSRQKSVCCRIVSQQVLLWRNLLLTHFMLFLHKAVVNADPDSVLQGPPPPKPAWIQKKLFEGDGAENDEEEVALVELKTDMLVCKDCGLRVHWRCYRSPFINTQVRPRLYWPSLRFVWVCDLQWSRYMVVFRLIIPLIRAFACSCAIGCVDGVLMLPSNKSQNRCRTPMRPHSATKRCWTSRATPKTSHRNPGKSWRDNGRPRGEYFFGTRIQTSKARRGRNMTWKIELHNGRRPVERPADTQCSWMNSRAYFELCCLVTVLNRIDGLGASE